MTFYVTFGQKYREEIHPQGAHPDGWTEVHADSELDARRKVVEHYGTKWAFLYDESDFQRQRQHYPLGCIERIV